MQRSIGRAPAAPTHAAMLHQPGMRWPRCPAAPLAPLPCASQDKQRSDSMEAAINLVALNAVTRQVGAQV
jgi:hypothetical protein